MPQYASMPDIPAPKKRGSV
jgi:hypothetical protein